MGSKLLEYFNDNELAANVWQSKYALEGEETPDDMHKRMAKEFARIEKSYIEKQDQNNPIDYLSDYGNSRDELDENSIYKLFKDFKYIIPQGSIMSQLGASNIGSLSNCFVVGQPYDSYGGIFQKDQELAQLMKRRGGVGIDISTLRPEGTTTTNAAKSSTGAISFMHRFSNTTREVAQNGRRGALMISIDINHPDVLDFIKIKRDLSQVTGANISIKLNDEFMKAVENDEDYFLRFPCDIDFNQEYVDGLTRENGVGFDDREFPKIYNKLLSVEDLHHWELHGEEKEYCKVKRIKAKEYWDEIIKSAHNVAEPGLMFWDNMVNYSPDGAYPQFRQITTNPCSEIAMQPYDACRLIAVNLFSFVVNPFTKDAYFDHEKFYQVNYEAMRLSDDLIDLELEHIERILDKIDSDPEPSDIKREEKELWKKVYSTAKASRRTGLGFTSLGDTLAALNLKYDSDEGLEIIKEILEIKLLSESDCTIDMAITRGTFEGWDPIKETGSFYHFLDKEFPEQASRMDTYGRRNVSWSTVAPTGSVSILTQTTGGVEPLFQPFYIRRKKVNPNDKDVRVDFTDQNGDTWQEFPVLHPKFKDWILSESKRISEEGCEESHIAKLMLKPGAIDRLNNDDLEIAFKQSPWFGSTANDIDWVKRVKIQALIQKYITHSISSTINLPSDVSEEAVSEIYLESWKQGLKGITVYRDGSRSGVMITETEKDKFNYHDAPKRPKSLDGEVHVVTALGEKYSVIVGLMDNKPYEVFVEPGDNMMLHNGQISKKKKGLYILENKVKDSVVTETLSLSLSDEEVALTRMISTALRHGADIKFVVEQLNKADGTIVSFSKAIARTLKKYIPDGTKSTVHCMDCGSDNVVFEEGCNKCLSCGSSACG
jgi:ribonucleoside-diphosphate reductase alpha chain